MTRFVVDVPLRWSDQDAYGHVNHARTVTLLEDARVSLIFDQAAESGLLDFSTGLLVARLSVDYRLPIPYGPNPVRVAMWTHQVRAASFEIDYVMQRGPRRDDPVAATARTQMVPYDLAAGRPRRLTGEERAFLARWAEE